MKKYTLFASVALVALTSASAMAQDISIKNLPDNGNIIISGTVESVENEREFKLRDSTGTVGVNIESDQSVVLKEGDVVSVTGIVDKGIAGTNIDANEINVEKSFSENVSDTVKSIPGISTTTAQAFNIGSLPEQGMVKVTGTVSDVDNEKEFTVNDETGSINIDVKSAETANLTEGARVTVIGVVNDGLFGKDIEAQQIIVISSAETNSDSY